MAHFDARSLSQNFPALEDKLSALDTNAGSLIGGYKEIVAQGCGMEVFDEDITN